MEVNFGGSGDLTAWAGVLVTAIVGIASWFAGYYFSVRAQRELLKAQHLATARKEIVIALRRRQDWIREVTSILHQLRFAQISEQQGFLKSPAEWFDVSREAHRIMFGDRSDWIETLEEYEGLLPETAKARRQLVMRSRVLHDMVMPIPTRLITAAGRAEILQRQPEIDDWAGNDAALLHDLLVHVQNRAFGSLAIGRNVAPRVPLVPTLPRIIAADDGTLTIEPASAVPPEPRYELGADGKVHEV